MLIAPPVMSQLPLRTYTSAAPVLELLIHGVFTCGATQLTGRLGLGFAVLMLSCPPVMLSPRSKTMLPPWNVTVVPLPIDRPLLQSTHQLPLTLTVPEGLQLCDVVHRW